MIRLNRDRTVTDERDPAVRETLIAMDEYEGYAVEYAPAENTDRSSTAVVLMHSDQNYMGLPMGRALAERGYRVFASESIAGGTLDRKIEKLGSLISYLRTRSDIRKIVLMGHSGGATLMTAYQAIAENGPEIYQRADMIYACQVMEKPEPADGIMLIDANYGNGVMTLLSLDPAVKTEGNGMDLDPSFDLFSKENGYSPDGAEYPEEFIRRYRTAQAKRNAKLIKTAQERLEMISSGKGNYSDDEPFFITGADQKKMNNRMLPQDIRQLSHTKREHTLLWGDGKTTYEIVRCLRVQECDRSFTDSFTMGAAVNTVKGFLSAQAIRADENLMVTEDDITGIDFRSSYASPIGNIEDISVPALFIGMTGSYEYLASEMIYDHARMEDKTIAFVRGASHMFAPEKKAERQPGEFGDTEKVLYDYMAEWLCRFA